MVGDRPRLCGHVGKDAVPTRSPRETRESHRAEVLRVPNVHQLEMRPHDSPIKAEELLMRNARAEGSKEVTNPGGDAEAEEDISLVRSKGGSPPTMLRWVTTKKDAVDGSQEVKSSLNAPLHKRLDIRCGPHRTAEDGVTGSNGGAISAHHRSRGSLQ